MNLVTGDKYTLHKKTPLMPEFKPCDPLFAVSDKGLARIVWLQKGDVIAIRSTRMKRTILWYEAEAHGADGRCLGKGWVNSVALLAPGIEIKADSN